MSRTIAICALVLFAASQPAAAQEEEQEKQPVFKKRVVVSARRLADEGEPLDKVPANVTVITREEIENGRARTLQELLALYAGIVCFDQTGSGLESTVGLRGFSDGTATAVYVDGVRVNEPDDNRANLAFLDLDTIERIEILPGGASVVSGSGALSGVVKVYTRRGYSNAGNEAYVSRGSFDATGAGIRSRSRMGVHSYFLSYGHASSGGFRDNGSVKQHKFLGKYNVDVEKAYNIELGYRYYQGRLGNPGSLTPGEMAADRTQSPFNQVDFSDSRESVLDLCYTRYFGEHALVTLSAFRRDAAIEVLTTGRSAAIWGGFSSESENGSSGLTAQFTYDRLRRSWNYGAVAGFDASRDDFGNLGFLTDVEGARTLKMNDRDTRQDNRATFLQGFLGLGSRATVAGGVRRDSVALSFRDNADGRGEERSFSEFSGSLGLTVDVVEGTSLYARWSRSFKTPTVNELFAFPFFGSNPELEPILGDTYEGGLRTTLARTMLVQASVFRMDLENEIVFVVTDPVWFIGSNENVGESRRSGLELLLRGEAAPGLNVLASYTFTGAENLSLAREVGAASLRLPLAPEHRFSARLDWRRRWFALGGDCLHVGEQVMSSDNENAGPLLDAYTVLNVRAACEFESWAIRLQVRNLLDRTYATRGFYSYGSTYLTPASGREVSLHLEFRY